MRKTLLIPGLAWLLSSCGTVPDAEPVEPDTSELQRVDVSHPRELRGVWVATVLRLDWPSAAALPPAEGRASLDKMVEDLAGLGFNALFFQVRPESDALYASALEPWSRFLSGTQGVNPGWDPLEHLLNAAHARGLEVHAWVNPYRGLTSPSVVAATGHVTRRFPGASVTYNNAVVMNPGEPEVRQHVKAVVKDLLDHYDVDGLHFDDYFYPYPDSKNTPFPDDATYARYREAGGTLELFDWRRDNINTLVREVMELIVSEHPHVRFGISPIGLWKNGEPLTGFDAYNSIACDAVTWMKEGWIDYLAPQLYWRESSKQSYSKLSTWWTNRAKRDVHVFPGHAVHNLSAELQNWPLSELKDQVTFTRGLHAGDARGDIHFRAKFILDDTKGVRALFHDELYAQPALPPAVLRPGATTAPPVPFVVVEGHQVHVTNPQPPDARFHLLYRELPSGDWKLERVAGGVQTAFEVESGTWAVSDIGRGGAESQGVRFSVP